ncbi:MAG: hypothetical protein K8F36_06445 [Melioribacteraceae bacterium]|nr:hypothetical protein [Melioribacteraceae bacterium]
MPAAKNLTARKVMPLAEFANKNLAAGKSEIEKILSKFKAHADNAAYRKFNEGGAKKEGNKIGT